MRQDEHLGRVKERIGAAILSFRGLTSDEQWHMDRLRQYVEAHVGAVAPASPDRILRALRAERLVNYRVVSRRDSLYEWQPVPPLVDLERAEQCELFP